MTNYGFQKQKFPQKHEFVIEQCTALHVQEFLGHLLLHQDKNFIPSNLPNNSGLRVVPTRAGFYVRWHFECPACQRRCESLYVPPGHDPSDWQCRICHDLIFGSQRFSLRHPLRKKMTHRQKARLRNEMMRSRLTNNGSPKILVQAEKFRQKLNGIGRESFTVILNIAKNGLDKKVQGRAQRLIRRYLTELKKMEKKSEAAKIVVIR